jgi:hypothetical protein
LHNCAGQYPLALPVVANVATDGTKVIQ